MSLMKDRLKNLIRTAKNSIKDYNPAERRVRDATSNQPWPPSSRTMLAICRDMTDAMLYDSVLVMLLKRLRDKGQVMHVRKSLQLVEFCLRHGNRRFIEDMKTRRYIFKELLSYRFLVHGQDKGSEVRSKAEYLMELLGDDSRLEQERTAAKRARSRMTGFSNSMVKRRSSLSRHREEISSPSNVRAQSVPPPSTRHTLDSPSSSSPTVSSESISLSEADSQSPELKPIEPPRKKPTDKPIKSSKSEATSAPNRGGQPAIPDNPFDPLSALFDTKLDTKAFEWVPDENDDGNRRRSATNTMANTRMAEKTEGSFRREVVAAPPPPSYSNMNGAMGPPSLPTTTDWLMTPAAYNTPGVTSNSGWYQQPAVPMLMPQQPPPVPLGNHRFQQQPQPFLALPPPGLDPHNPFL